MANNRRDEIKINESRITGLRQTKISRVGAALNDAGTIPALSKNVKIVPGPERGHGRPVGGGRKLSGLTVETPLVFGPEFYFTHGFSSEPRSWVEAGDFLAGGRG